MSPPSSRVLPKQPMCFFGGHGMNLTIGEPTFSKFSFLMVRDQQ
jgi:hypothetical protein